MVKDTHANLGMDKMQMQMEKIKKIMNNKEMRGKRKFIEQMKMK